MNERPVLITGATGFIGSHVLERFGVSPPGPLHLIIREPDRSSRITVGHPEKVNIHRGHFFQPDLLRTIFEQEAIHTVIHLAAIRGSGAAAETDYQRVNTDGTASLYGQARTFGVRRFIHCSSVGVHGTIPHRVPAPFDAPLDGDNPYHRSKIEAEEIIKAGMDGAMETCIVRPTITYGARDDGFPATLVRLARLRRLLLPAPDILIHLLDVHSFARLILDLVLADSVRPGIYAVGDRDPVSLRLLVDSIHRRYHRKPYPPYLTVPRLVFRLSAPLFRLAGSRKWPGRLKLFSRDWYYDTEPVRRHLGFLPSDTNSVFINSVCRQERTRQ